MIELVGNESIQEYLAKASLKGTWLFFGPKVGKATFAKQFATSKLQQEANSSLAQHPDLHIYRPLGKAAFHTIESMKELLREIHLPPTMAKQKFFIIEHADRMPTPAANFLLKTLEEHPENATIILTSHKKLIPTIESRAQKIHFCPIEAEKIESYLIENANAKSKDAKKVATLAFGSLSKALLLLDDHLPLFESFHKLLMQIDELSFPDMKQGAQYIDKAIESSKKNLEKKLLERLKDQELPKYLQDVQKKQIEGEITLYGQELIEILFDWLLRHFRDGYVVEKLRFFSNTETVKPLLLVDGVLMQAKKMLSYQMRLGTVLEKVLLDLQTI